MSTKENILSALRARTIPSVPLPDLVDFPAIRYADPVAQFCAMVQAVGGRTEIVSGRAGLRAALAALPILRTARQVASLIPETPAQMVTVDLKTTADPHALEPLEVVLAESPLGVAENGALWFDQSAIPERAALFITQHVVFVIETRNLVHNLHEAYARLCADKAAPDFARATAGYGLWISGPSKTADIEQSLVIGAHGARSATVFVVT